MPPSPNRAKPKPGGVPTKTRTLADEVSAAVKAATWITSADAATVALAIRLAKEIEVDLDPRLGKLLVDVLTSLGLTVAGRGSKPDEPKQGVSKLDVIRERAATRQHSPKTGNPKPRPAK